MGEDDFVSGMDPLERRLAEERLKNINPDDAKYADASAKVAPYLSADAEWRGCALVQKVLLETRVEFGKAEKRHLAEVEACLDKLSPLNMSLLEKKVTKHDQLAVIEEIGRYVSEETKALLHPWTTSYDILDTARAYLFRKAWKEVMRPKVKEVIGKLCDMAGKPEYLDLLQVGRTHLQDTSPITFGVMLAGYARRLAENIEECDRAFNGLRGKVSGIVGTGASIEAVIGKDEPDEETRHALALEFERKTLEKLGLEPDYTATQIVQKERLFSVGNGIVCLMSVIANFANRMRILYSSAIGEVTSRDSKQRLGGSSADAGKNNPVELENIAGTYPIVKSGMIILYAQSETDLERDLRNSKPARYEPQLMMTRTYESFVRLSKVLDQLSVNDETMRENLVPVREKPTEAMTAITRAYGYIHPEHGVGHDAVKKFARQAQKGGKNLLEVALVDEHFRAAFETWSDWNQAILRGELERYIGPAKIKARENIEYARRV